MINITTGVITDITGSVSTAIGDLLPILAVIFGVIISFFVMRRVLYLFVKR